MFFVMDPDDAFAASVLERETEYGLETAPASVAFKEASRGTRAAKEEAFGADAQFGTFYTEEGDTALFSFQTFKTHSDGWEDYYAGKAGMPVENDSYAALVDDDVSFDLNFAVLTCGSSYSSANLLPQLLHERGIAVIGERSGGGPYAVEFGTTADGWRYTMSCNTQVTSDTWENIDGGVPVDIELVKTNDDGTRDYNGFYDLEAVGDAIESFYGEERV